MVQRCSNKKSNKIFTKKFIVDKNRKISIFTLYYAQGIKELRQIALTKKLSGLKTLRVYKHSSKSSRSNPSPYNISVISLTS